MSEKELMAIAEEADMIVQGYAFIRKGKNISVLNLNKPTGAIVISEEGKMLETSMDPIEQAIVLKIWERDAEFMEEENA
jgi:multisubunit Na+/H+ antiporter MnhC subunit